MLQNEITQYMTTNLTP
ncbi:unnamed protein product, partial [Rotaria sordida]